MRITGFVFIAATLLLAGALGCEPELDAPRDENGVPLLKVPEDLAERLARRDIATHRSAALTEVQSCDDLSRLLHATVVADTIEQIQRTLAHYWKAKTECHLPGPNLDGGVTAVRPPPAAAPPAHSETNNQVSGVDEPDLIKTDGKRIVVLADGMLKIVKAWPAKDAALVGQIAIEGTPTKLLIHEDRVLVYSSPTNMSRDGRSTRITIVDVSDPAQPKVARELVIDASMVSARRIGAAVHTVVTKRGVPQQWIDSRPEGIWACDNSEAEIYEAFQRLLRTRLVEALEAPAPSPRAVLPKLTDSAGISKLEECRLHRSSLEDGLEVTSVLSLSLAKDDGPVHALSILSPAAVVYGAEQALYLAVARSRGTAGWFEGFEQSQGATAIHKLALDSSDPGAPKTRYAASGLAAGALANQFSIDAHEGFVRVAATDYASRETHTTLTVLEQQGRTLKRVGLLEGLAPGEDIRSVRFDGRWGYVVTFELVRGDPLFVIDLADPRKPKVAGELKIPGFSSYIHMLDERHLLTIGFDGTETWANLNAVALQIFDVSDPADPKLAHKRVLGSRGSNSAAQQDHLAFNFSKAKNLLALPMTICEGEGQNQRADEVFSGLILFETTVDKGFVERGRVPHPVREDFHCHWGESQVTRSLFIGDFVYSLSADRIKVNHLDALGSDVAQVALTDGTALKTSWEADEAEELTLTGAEISSARAHSGSRSLRCWTDADGWLGESFHFLSEARATTSGWVEAWYYLPSAKWTPRAPGSWGDYILRLANDNQDWLPGEGNKLPVAGLTVRPAPGGGNQLVATIGRDPDPDRAHVLGPLITDRWFRLRVMLRQGDGTKNNPGQIKVWLDDQLVLDHYGLLTTWYSSPHLAFGLYSTDLNVSQLSGPVAPRELFVDSLRTWKGRVEPAW